MIMMFCSGTICFFVPSDGEFPRLSLRLAFTNFVGQRFVQANGADVDEHLLAQHISPDGIIGSRAEKYSKL
jgi:hypothetical protein